MSAGLAGLGYAALVNFHGSMEDTARARKANSSSAWDQAREARVKVVDCGESTAGDVAQNFVNGTGDFIFSDNLIEKVPFFQDLQGFDLTSPCSFTEKIHHRKFKMKKAGSVPVIRENNFYGTTKHLLRAHTVTLNDKDILGNPLDLISDERFEPGSLTKCLRKWIKERKQKKKSFSSVIFNHLPIKFTWSFEIPDHCDKAGYAKLHVSEAMGAFQVRSFSDSIVIRANTPNNRQSFHKRIFTVSFPGVDIDGKPFSCLLRLEVLYDMNTGCLASKSIRGTWIVRTAITQGQT